MQVFKAKNNVLTPVGRNSFELEKEIQSLVESNMETLFSLEFVSSEFSVGDFRLDSLAFDEQNNAFVIVEYKKGHNYSVVDPGYSYLSTMLSSKADFILEYNESTGKELKRSEVDWSSSRVIFVSPSFNSYQKNSVNFRDVPFELWEVKRFDGGLITIEQWKSTSQESIEKLSKSSSNSANSKVTEEVKVISEQEHVNKLGETLKPLWSTFREKLGEYPETSFATTQKYISWKRDNTGVCFIHFRKNEMYIEILRGNIKETGEKSKGFFTIDDPKSLTKERSWTWKSDGLLCVR